MVLLPACFAKFIPAPSKTLGWNKCCHETSSKNSFADFSKKKEKRQTAQQPTPSQNIAAHNTSIATLATKVLDISPSAICIILTFLHRSSLPLTGLYTTSKIMTEAQNHALSRLGASLSNLFVGTGLENNAFDGSDEPESPATADEKQKKHIETLEKVRVDQDQTMAAILTEMVDHRAEAEKSKKRLELEAAELRRENEHLKKCLKAMDADIEDRHALSEYAKMIQEQAPCVIDTPYVMRLKSQLAKALHKMGVLSNQLDLTKEENECAIKDLHDQIVEAETAKNKAEVEFVSQYCDGR